MEFSWTASQRKRLSELNTPDFKDMIFQSTGERNAAYKRLELAMVKQGREHLNKLRNENKRPAILLLEERLVKALTSIGFIQVTTPIILSKKLLAKMTIDDNHALFSQVFWLDENSCLRPMLAPNLYYVSKDLLRLWDKPIGIFEIGSCFRKESQGNRHLNEFTMLNLVEWGLPEEERATRITQLAEIVMETVGIREFNFEETSSVVYGDTLDVMYQDTELASGAMGPHFLDGKWGITIPWVGIGFGLERMLMIKEGGQNVKSMGKSLSYLDGVRLNL